MRQAGQPVGKMRRMAAEFQTQFMDAVREAELDEIRKDVAKLEGKRQTHCRFRPGRDGPRRNQGGARGRPASPAAAGAAPPRDRK